MTFQANGELYYFASLGGLLLTMYVRPEVSVAIYENMGAILGGLNLVAFLICLLVFLKAKLKQKEDDPYLRDNVVKILINR